MTDSMSKGCGGRLVFQLVICRSSLSILLPEAEASVNSASPGGQHFQGKRVILENTFCFVLFSVLRLELESYSCNSCLSLANVYSINICLELSLAYMGARPSLSFIGCVSLDK